MTGVQTCALPISTIGTPGVTLVTFTKSLSTSPAAGTLVYIQTGGYTIWQHEFGQNAVGLNTESAIYSSITTSDISWLTGNPSQDGLVGVNRRMHLRRIEPDFIQTGDMTVQVIGRAFARGDEQDSPIFTFGPNDGKVDLRIENRESRLLFESNTLNGDYQMGRILKIGRAHV